MSSADDSAAAPPAPPHFSVFISYASEDRAAARLLRDALSAAGLDVWYDENELGGGDAWDQKIRRQIRDCSYFMPVISATTERRREGYFRREWRLATERTMDMADDVTFLVPVVIDDTRDTGARVPEKFLTVQWLRLPGGQPTPALSALARRLVAGDHAAPARPAPAAPPRVPPPLTTAAPARPAPTPAPPAHAEGPPPMPPFPHAPERGQRGHVLKFLAEVFWWVLTAAWLLFKRLPKWGRVLVTIWIVIALFSRSSDDPPSSPKKPRTSHVETAVETDFKKEEAAQSLRDAADKLELAAKAKDASNLGAGFARAGAELARAVSTEIAGGRRAPGRVGVVPFDAGLTSAGSKIFAETVFSTAYGQLALALKDGLAVLPVSAPLPDDDTLRALAEKAGDDYVLVARTEAGETGPAVIELRMLATADRRVVWSQRYPVESGNAPAVAGEIVQAVLKALPKP
jgi:hypothetical protein